MKQNKVKNYAKALAEIILEQKTDRGRASISGNFLALIKKNSLERKLKEIVELAENIILEKTGKQRITFLTARKITASQRKILNNVAKTGDQVKEKINPELIAGVKVVINENRQLDMSMANKLSKIFK